MKQVHMLISGRVQGVSFRFNVKWRARKLGLVGFIKNLEDGRVEVVAEGDDKRLSEMVDYCKKGPVLARVDDIKIEYKMPTNKFDAFRIFF